MYTFTPMTEEEIQSSNLLEDGDYDFEVVKSTRKISKANNPMAELQLNVWDKEGRQHLVYDYLIFSTVPLNIKKIKHFCEAVGLHEEYNKGSIPEELERCFGSAHFSKQNGAEIPNDKLNGKPIGSRYPDKNVVDDYIKKETKQSNPLPFDDTIPF